nr:retrovirus-related Pol polyprotein from transposon TNT 1-94 [Tanacetum cinerariifolium]
FSMRSAVWHDRAVWHMPEQFSSELNNIYLCAQELYTVQRSKEVNMAVGDSDAHWLCCVENIVEGRIMDSGALFHATYCKKELERFKLRSGKVRLADDKYLYIASVGDVVLKTSFGTSWTLKDVRCWSKFIQKAMTLHLLHQSKDPATMILLSKTAAGVAVGLMQTFRAKSTGLRAEAPKMLWADSVSTAYLIYCIPYVPKGLRILEEEWRGNDTSLTHLKEVAQIKCDTAFGIRRVTRLSEVKTLHLWTRFMKPANDSIVLEYGLSLKITQSPGRSSDTSEGSENSGRFKDSGRSDKEYSKGGASCKEGGSKTPHV